MFWPNSPQKGCDHVTQCVHCRCDGVIVVVVVVVAGVVGGGVGAGVVGGGVGAGVVGGYLVQVPPGE